MEFILAESYKVPESIDFNYQELKTEIQAKMKEYEGLVYDDSQIKTAKADLATLRKFKDALSEQRKALKREYLAPFDAFEAKITELTDIVNRPINLIDAQVKDYDNKVKEQKRTEVTAYFNGMDETPSWLKIEQIWNDRWLNKTCQMETVKKEIDSAVKKINGDMDTLAALPEFGFEAQDEYMRTLDLPRAIAEGQRLAAIQQKKEAMKKAEEARHAAMAEQIKESVKESVQTDAQEAPAVNIAEPKQQKLFWVAFEARLTAETAGKLRAFFRENGIEYRAL